MTTARKPAITRTIAHPADAIPDRPAAVTPTPPQPEQSQPAAPSAHESGGGETERYTEQHNVRIRPSTKGRLIAAVNKLRYETGDRSISLASLTDEAIDAYLTHRGC